MIWPSGVLVTVPTEPPWRLHLRPARPGFIGQLGDHAAVEVHAEQVVVRALVRGFVLAGGAVRKEDDLVLAGDRTSSR